MPDPLVCPGNGTSGRRVEWRTVAALALGPIPPRREYRLCDAPDCDILYFSTDGHCLRVTDLRFEPGIKSTRPEALLCYCFLHRRRDFSSEILQGGKSALCSRIAAEVKAGNCACEVRNPTGHCCLGELKREIAKIARA